MLKINNLSVSYSNRPVLQDVSLAIKGGEILALIGPNGAGKSTLVRAVSGVIPIQGGNISVDDQDLSHLAIMDRAKYLSVVPQAHNLPAAFTVYESVMLGRTPYLGWLGRTSQFDHECVMCSLESTQLLEFSDRYVGELSGGEQQRVLLARALTQGTPVMLLDEPTTHLDLQYQAGLIKLVRSLAREKKIAILMVLHDLNLASLYSDRVALLVEGKVRSIGTPSEVLTEATLSSVYHIPIQVIPHPEYGNPLVLPDGIK
jgi:ABC-type cobalamin/Fe3+-siderophores transport system ATPase subunit